MGLGRADFCFPTCHDQGICSVVVPGGTLNLSFETIRFLEMGLTQPFCMKSIQFCRFVCPSGD